MKNFEPDEQIEARPPTEFSETTESRKVMGLEQEFYTALDDLSYPGPQCLHADEVTKYVITGKLNEYQQAHVQSCGTCSALLVAAVPDSERLKKFVSEVEKRTNHYHPRSPLAASVIYLEYWFRPKQILIGFSYAATAAVLAVCMLSIKSAHEARVTLAHTVRLTNTQQLKISAKFKEDIIAAALKDAATGIGTQYPSTGEVPDFRGASSGSGGEHKVPLTATRQRTFEPAHVGGKTEYSTLAATPLVLPPPPSLVLAPSLAAPSSLPSTLSMNHLSWSAQHAETGPEGRSAVLVDQTRARLTEVVGTFDNYQHIITESFFFNVNDSKLAKHEMQKLDDAVAKMRGSINYVLEIQAMRDTSMTAQKSLELSRKRANEVVRYLTVKHNVPLRRIHVISGVEEVLDSDNRGEEARRQTRRVDMNVYARPQSDATASQHRATASQ